MMVTEQVVRVRAPARLHLGFLDPGGRGARRFGGIGLALDAPATTLTLRRAHAFSAEGAESERLARLLPQAAAALGLSGTFAVHATEAIPAHAGLGSGTQLALALAAGLRTLAGLPLDVGGDAVRLGRGARSGVGAAFFTGGGVVVDGGRDVDRDRPAPVVAQLPFPEAWRVLLILQPSAAGFHGADELAAFAALPPFPREATAENCRLVLMQALPALAERDVAGFGQAVETIQTAVGTHFAPAQGGIFASPAVARLAARLKSLGAHGVGQSSWGPTGFAFAENEAEAARIVEAAGGQARDEGLVLAVARGRNEGATIEAPPAGARLARAV